MENNKENAEVEDIEGGVASETFVLSMSEHKDGTKLHGIRFQSEEDENDKKPAKEKEDVENSRADENRTQAIPSFHELSSSWVLSSIGFFEVVPLFTRQNLRLASQEMAETAEEFAREVALSVKKYDDNETKVTDYILSLDDLPLVGNKLGRSSQAYLAVLSMSQAALGALLSEYEHFISHLLHCCSKVSSKPFLNSSDTITAERLDHCDSIEDLRTELVAQKIETLLHHKSHMEVLGWISEQFKIDVHSDKELISDFTEVCQRRHLLAHCGGVVNKRYLDICEKAGCEMESLPKLGEIVRVDRKYLRRATARVFQIGFFLLHILWQKISPKDAEESQGRLLTASHEFLEIGLTKMCRRVCQFALKSKKPLPERTSAYLTVNLALSFAHDETLEDEKKQKQIEDVLSRRDWSMITPTVRLALACLKQEYDDLEKLTTAAIEDEDGVSYYDAHTWAVFKEVRKRDDFLVHFKRSAKSV